MYTFTIFTPTYNRAHVLPRAFASIAAQTFRDFEWLVVDDGSTDGTADLVQGWVNQADFPIRYVWQENGHIKAAHNRALTLAQGELFLRLDSDDAALPEALETFRNVWAGIPDDERPRFSAVTAMCVDPFGRIVGDRFPRDVLDSTTMETRYRYRVEGEKWGFHRTDVLRQFPFDEEIDGLVPEGIIWHRISRHYLTRYVNVPLRVYYPSADSVTAGLRNLRARAPGRTTLAAEILQHDWRWLRHDPVALLKEAVAYSYFRRHIEGASTSYEPPSVRGFIPRALVAATWPVATALYLKDRLQNR